MRPFNFLMTLSLPLVAAVSFSACSVETTDRAADGERGQHLGKADQLDGSCEDACGGQSDDGCWCDDACSKYGDCCGDVAQVCDGDQCVPGNDDTCPEGMSCLPGVCLAFCLPDDPNCCAPSTCVDFDDDGDDGEDNEDNDDAADDGDTCPPVVCALFCENGFQTDEDGCEICSCKDVEPPPAGTCLGNCGGSAEGKVCYCDELCSEYGDCCEDYEEVCETDCPNLTPPPPDFCEDGEIEAVIGDFGCVVSFECVMPGDREIAEGACVKNSLHACESDDDCIAGGCGGELCFNPDEAPGFSTCECTTPQGPSGCGCVEGVCAWYND